MPTDWAKPTTGVLARLADPRVAQFWDKDHLISQSLEATVPGGEPACCRQGGALWDVVALYAPGSRLGHSSPEFISGPVVDSIGALRPRLASLSEDGSAARLPH
ncbi:MAG: hypothetical protein KGL59_09935 [Acidobacteriota bacterium]|nr:hypothetical protein [Acidobacteriota bacterium]